MRRGQLENTPGDSLSKSTHQQIARTGNTVDIQMIDMLTIPCSSVARYLRREIQNIFACSRDEDAYPPKLVRLASTSQGMVGSFGILPS